MVSEPCWPGDRDVNRGWRRRAHGRRVEVQARRRRSRHGRRGRECVCCCFRRWRGRRRPCVGLRRLLDRAAYVSCACRHVSSSSHDGAGVCVHGIIRSQMPASRGLGIGLTWHIAGWACSTGNTRKKTKKTRARKQRDSSRDCYHSRRDVGRHMTRIGDKAKHRPGG